MSKPTVFIIGAGGMVGSAAAQSIAIQEIVNEIVLIDVAEDMAMGQALDISHATAFTSGVRVRVGEYNEIREDDIVVVTCGQAQKPGQSRLELLETNQSIIRDITTKIMAQGKPVFILVVSNPVDILTHVALETSGLPRERVFGTGTTLDTARLRVAMAYRLGISPKTIDAYILGEHGDSSFPVLSSATICGVPLEEFPGYSEDMISTIERDIRRSAYDIIEAKGSTYYGIGQVVAKIVEAMVRDTPSVFPVCSLADGEYGINGTVIGLPSLVSGRGVRIIDKYPLSDEERRCLDTSVDIIKKAMG